MSVCNVCVRPTLGFVLSGETGDEESLVPCFVVLSSSEKKSRDEEVIGAGVNSF